MKIAVWYHLPSGGGKRAVHDQVAGLRARGHEVEVWMPSTANLAFMPIPEDVPQHVLPLEWSEGTESRIARWGRPWRFARKLAAMRSHAERVGVETAGFDVLLAHSCAWFAAPHVARTSRVPCAVYLHEVNRGLHEAGDGSLPWIGPVGESQRHGRLGRWHEVLERWRDLVWQRRQAREEWRNARAATRLLVNSWFSSENATRVYGRRGEVCEPGVDTALWTDPGHPRERRLVGVGAIAAHKGVAQAVEVVAALDPAVREGTVLEWFGNGADDDYRRALESRSAELGVELRLRVGAGEDDIREALRRASVFVYPSRLEPFGYAPLEAAACGCPVVGVREGGVRETMVDGVTAILADGSVEAMSAAVSRLLLDEPLARRLGAAGRRRVEETYSLEASIDRLEAALRRTVARP